MWEGRQQRKRMSAHAASLRLSKKHSTPFWINSPEIWKQWNKHKHKISSGYATSTIKSSLITDCKFTMIWKWVILFDLNLIYTQYSDVIVHFLLISCYTDAVTSGLWHYALKWVRAPAHSGLLVEILMHDGLMSDFLRRDVSNCFPMWPIPSIPTQRSRLSSAESLFSVWLLMIHLNANVYQSGRLQTGR